MNNGKLIKKALLLIGKSDMTLDESIPPGYLFLMCWENALSVARGFLRRHGFAEYKGLCLIGRHVRFRCKSKISLGKSVRLKNGVFIDALSCEGVNLSDGVLIGRNGRIECTGSLSSVGKGLKIGIGTTFGSDCYFGAAGGIEIGADVMGGQYIRFHSENHIFENVDMPIRQQGVTHKGIVIGDGCWIGAGAVFLDGADLGKGCVVAANAVVPGKKFPPYSVIGGVPARVLRSRR